MKKLLLLFLISAHISTNEESVFCMTVQTRSIEIKRHLNFIFYYLLRAPCPPETEVEIRKTENHPTYRDF